MATHCLLIITESFWIFGGVSLTTPLPFPVPLPSHTPRLALRVRQIPRPGPRAALFGGALRRPAAAKRRSDRATSRLPLRASKKAVKETSDLGRDKEQKQRRDSNVFERPCSFCFRESGEYINVGISETGELLLLGGWKNCTTWVFFLFFRLSRIDVPWFHDAFTKNGDLGLTLVGVPVSVYGLSEMNITLIGKLLWLRAR